MTSGKGELGELVATIVLQHAFCLGVDYEEPFFKPVPLKRYLRSLFGVARFEKDIEENLPEAYVSFTKWWQIQGDPTPETLYWAFSVRCALVARPNQTAIDLIIPIVIRPKGDGLFEAKPEHMSAVLIQVKSWTNTWGPKDMSDCFQSIDESAHAAGLVRHPHVSILMQMGEGGMGGYGKGKQRPKDFTPPPAVHTHAGKGHCRFYVSSIDSLPNIMFTEKSKTFLKEIVIIEPVIDSMKRQYNDLLSREERDRSLLATSPELGQY